MTERDQWDLHMPGFDRDGTVVRHGHWGRPVVVFPSEQGRAWDYENNGMVDAVRDLIDAGRVKLYCVDSVDGLTWSDRSIPLEERAARHRGYEAWITDRVVPLIDHDSPGRTDLMATGCSLGAYHALQIALHRADLFPLAMCQSGNYDPAEWHGWGERGDAAYFTNPTDYVPHLGGDHLDWLRSACTWCSPSARGRGRPTRPARCPAPAGWRGCSPSAGCPTSSTSGAMTVPTTGSGGSASSPTTCPGSADS